MGPEAEMSPRRLPRLEGQLAALVGMGLSVVLVVVGGIVAFPGGSGPAPQGGGRDHPRDVRHDNDGDPPCRPAGPLSLAPHRSRERRSAR